MLIVTEALRDATSTDIADYNAFVTADANASPTLAALGSQWSAVASTATVSARDNTQTDPSPAGPNGVPIYRPDGTRLANDYDDLWDGALLAAPNRTSLGNVTSANFVWTGVVFDGQTTVGHPLGSDPAYAGFPAIASAIWTGANELPYDGQLPLYGISEVLVAGVAANVTDLGPGCSYGSRAFRFVPRANGGHDVIDAGSSAFDPLLGSLAGVTEDDLVTATGLDLGFAFPFPSAGGTAPEQFVRIDPNGRILPDSCGLTNGVYVPSVADLMSAGYPMVCPFWTDFNVNEPGSDSVYFKTAPGAATFTWNHVTQYGAPAAAAMTVQCTLFANGEVLVVLEDVQGFNANPIWMRECLIGISSGNATIATAPVDLSHIVSGPSASGNPAYEFFDIAPVEQFDLAIALPTLDAVTLPQLGSNFVFEIRNAPAAANIGLYLVGFDALPAPIPLSLVGFATPCSLAVSFVDIQLVLPSGSPGVMGAGQIFVPAPTSMLGLELYLQGATDGAPFTSPLLTTNTLRATLGQ